MPIASRPSRAWWIAIAMLSAIAATTGRTATQAESTTPRSADWLALLPDGEEKRRFILDCTGCHLFNEAVTQANGRPRSHAEWSAAVQKMLGFAGATSGFPVIGAARNAGATADWLVASIGGRSPVPPPVAQAASVTEYFLPDPADLAHDLAIDSAGQIIVTGMRTHRMYTLNPEIGEFGEVAIPVERANPRAVEVASNGDWWVVLGAPNMLARYSPSTREWVTTALGLYAHSVAIAANGSAWFNGHFTRDPELLGVVAPQGGTATLAPVPPHPIMAAQAGGPIPYEVRVAPDGRVWMSELAGNRLIAYDPKTRQSRAFDMPTSVAGPRRFDIDGDGVVWIPEYSANKLARLDPATGRVAEIALPVADALPYVVRVDDARRSLWVGTAAADAVLRYDRDNGTWREYALPSRGALIRHLAVDRRSGDIWIAYGASPGIAARIARLRP